MKKRMLSIKFAKSKFPNIFVTTSLRTWKELIQDITATYQQRKAWKHSDTKV